MRSRAANREMQRAQASGDCGLALVKVTLRRVPLAVRGRGTRVGRSRVAKAIVKSTVTASCNCCL